MLVKLAHCVAESVKDTELVAGRHDVDVADLLRLNHIAISLRHDP